MEKKIKKLYFIHGTIDSGSIGVAVPSVGFPKSRGVPRKKFQGRSKIS